MLVKEGDVVRVCFVCKLTDGKVFERSMIGIPLEFEVGAGNVIPGLEKAVLGMQVDEKKVVEIPSEEAFGPRRDDLVLAVPKRILPQNVHLEAGEFFEVAAPDGSVLPATVKDVTEDAVIVDANHPLAGKDLMFEIHLVGLNSE
jgi:FKBP-type peptidyl-prolyl cis-trans isomerase 2